MNLGAHMSIAGGLELALRRGRDAGCGMIQLFTGTARGWTVKDVTTADAARFEQARRDTGIDRAVVHAGYLINLAAPADFLWNRSVDAMAAEIRRSCLLRATDVVVHPGAHMGAGEAAGLRRIARGLDEIQKRAGGRRGPGCRIALEITAGQGSALGWRFEHIRDILDRVRHPDRHAVCFDTCHAFAAGRDIRTKAGLEDALAAFDKIIGLDRLTVFHLNDSQKPLASRVDRHAHIGKGEIGRECFKALLRDKRLQDRPMLLETPKEGKAEGEWDRCNLALLRRLRGRDN